MSFDITIGTASQPDSGFDIVIGDSGDGAMLDFELPNVFEGTVLLIAIVRNGSVLCSDPTWTQAVSGVGAGDIRLDVWSRVADGTSGSQAGDVVSFVSVTNQELQGSLVTLRYADADGLIYDTAHGAFTSDAAPEPPSIDADGENDLALCIWSTSGDVEIVAPPGFRTIDAYTSSEISERSIAVATRRARETGTLTLEPAALSPAGTGRAFTLAIHYDPPPGGHSHWGPHTPDAARRVVTVPARASTLALSTVASGSLTLATVRARAAGIAGDLLQFAIEADAAGPTDVHIEEDAGEVTAHVEDNATTVAELAALINTDSTLIEFLPGASNPADIVQTGDDEFSLTSLSGGRDATEGRVARFWGPHFPLAAVADPPLVSAPVTAADIAARLEGLTLTLSWATGVFKAEDGKERRAGLLDDPRQMYDGSVMLFGAEPLALREQLAAHAATGASFGLGLPFEEATVGALSAATSVPLTTTALDWAVAGQRVLFIDGADDDVTTSTAVIQAVASNSLTLDTAITCRAGTRIMPLVPVLLDPQQGFARYRSGADRWQIKAYGERFGFAAAAIPGELTMDLAGESVTFRAKTAGVSVSLSADFDGAIEPTASITADELGNYSLFVEMPTGSTLADLNSYMNELGLITMLGDFDPDAVLTFADDFTSTAFTGAAAASNGEMGRGATLETLGGLPLWDRGLENGSTMTDSLQSLTEIVEIGIGVPHAVATAAAPDWGRSIVHSGDIGGSDWQWFKKMLASVAGQWKTFYLPTDRADLQPQGNASAAEVTILAGSYELFAARGYQHLQVRQGTATHYVTITGATNNGDGTITLSLSGDTLSAAAVSMLSWCELVHLDTDEVQVQFSGSTFTAQMRARVVQQ